MGSPPVADVIELEQLLARYAVGMTMDDVDAVVDVFTPERHLQRLRRHLSLADFPTLVAAAPRACSWSVRRRSPSTATRASGASPCAS